MERLRNKFESKIVQEVHDDVLELYRSAEPESTTETFVKEIQLGEGYDVDVEVEVEIKYISGIVGSYFEPVELDVTYTIGRVSYYYEGEFIGEDFYNYKDKI